MGGSGTALGFYTLTPCRLVDTRSGDRDVRGSGADVRGVAGLPAAGPVRDPVRGAGAVAQRDGDAARGGPGNLSLYPAGPSAPNTSVINHVANQTRANNAIIGLNSAGDLAVLCTHASGTAHFVLDVNGYFK